MSAEHHHGAHPVHLDEADWEAMAAHTELEGEVLIGFVTEAAASLAALRGSDARPVRRIVDVGSGPGVGTCELAIRFPDATVVAVDGSPAMLERARRRAEGFGLGARIDTHLAELPGGLDGVADADIVWASMSLHHVGDEVGALRVLRGLLAPDGLLAVAEIADPTRVLPDDLDVGRPGLADRIDHVADDWFAGMREGLADSTPSADLPSMLAAAGFDVVESRVARIDLDPPLSDLARRMAQGHLRRTADHLRDHLDEDDASALAVLSDERDPRSVLHRPDVVVAASRQIVIARPTTDR